MSSPSYPSLPESPALRAMREMAEQMLAEHDTRMAPFRDMINNGVLADVQRITEKMQFAIAPTPKAVAAFTAAQAAIDSAISPEVRRMLEDITKRNDTLFARIKATAPPSDLVPVLEARASARIKVETVATAAVSAAPTQRRPAGGSLTREQKAEAIALLLAAHGTVMSLRRGDLADSGALLLMLAVLMLILALDSDASE